MNQQTAIILPKDMQPIIELVTNALTSEHSKRAYTHALVNFLAWRGDRPITKALVNEYRQTLKGSAARVNLIMSAIRKLASEAADNGYMDQQTANGIKAAPGVKAHGERAGNWLTKQEAQNLLTCMDLQPAGKASPKAYRDRAILAVMIGGGLRRSEVSALTMEHIQQRDSRWVIVDMIGKGNHVRSIPVPPWVKLAIDEWRAVAGIDGGGLVFQAIHKGGHITHDSITPQAIRDVVKHYGALIGRPELAAHDLRRTYAKLAHKGGAGVDQIQLSLGHLSLKTTERYLGTSQSLTDAPGDRLGLSLD